MCYECKTVEERDSCTVNTRIYRLAFAIQDALPDGLRTDIEASPIYASPHEHLYVYLTEHEHLGPYVQISDGRELPEASVREDQPGLFLGWHSDYEAEQVLPGDGAGFIVEVFDEDDAIALTLRLVE